MSPVQHVLYVNLARATERRRAYQDQRLPASYGDLAYQRVAAVDGSEVTEAELGRMISLPTIRPAHHAAKMGCYLSHIRVLQQIVGNRWDGVLILEDDAVVRDHPIPEGVASLDGVCFFGGWATSRRVCDAKLPLEFLAPGGLDDPVSIQTIPEAAPYRILQSRAYYLPTYGLAKELLEWLEGHARVRAYDVMLSRFPKTRYFVYPALVTNRVGLRSCRDVLSSNREELLSYR